MCSTVSALASMWWSATRRGTRLPWKNLPSTRCVSQGCADCRAWPIGDSALPSLTSKTPTGEMSLRPSKSGWGRSGDSSQRAGDTSFRE